MQWKIHKEKDIIVKKLPFCTNSHTKHKEIKHPPTQITKTQKAAAQGPIIHKNGVRSFDSDPNCVWESIPNTY